MVDDAICELTMTFHHKGNGDKFMVAGWSNPEPSHCWTLGAASQLHLPPMRGEQASLMTVEVAPYNDGSPAMQAPLEIAVNGRDIGRLTLKPGFEVHSLIVPPGILSPTAVNTLRLVHPKHKPAHLEGNDDVREVAMAVRKISIEPLGFELHPMPVLLPRVDRPSLERQAEMAVKFESLGQNCEFGMFQRRCGAEPLGLLRFASTSLSNVIHGLETGFEGIDDPEKLHMKLGVGGKEYMGHHDFYGLAYHTFRTDGEIDVEKFTLTEAKRLRFLARMLAEDVEDANKVFVIQRTPRLSLSAALSLFKLLRARNLANRLLWVMAATSSEAHMVGRAEQLGPGLYRGYLDRLANPETVPNLSFDSWLEVCSAVEADLGPA